MTQFLGIRRERIFSPGKVADDAAVLDAVAERLRGRGHAVTVIDGDAPQSQWPQPNRTATVFTMCQGAAALDVLSRWQAGGVHVVNSPQSIRNCQRHSTIALLQQARIAFPESILVNASDHATDWPLWISAGAWVKRGDFHATEAADVVRVNDAEGLRAALERFEQRGIARAVVQRHMPGTVLKFYAVRGTFYHCVRPPDGPSIAADALAHMRALGECAARALGVEIYGGDCVYDRAQGTLSLIDLNDWPSYAACRAEAATEIAAYLHARDIASRR